MFERGTQFVLKVEERKLFFNNRDFLPVEKVFLHLAEVREVESFSRRYRGIKEGHENFVRIIHDYQDDGFAKWKKQIEQLLDENG